MILLPSEVPAPASRLATTPIATTPTVFELEQPPPQPELEFIPRLLRPWDGGHQHYIRPDLQVASGTLPHTHVTSCTHMYLPKLPSHSTLQSLSQPLSSVTCRFFFFPLRAKDAFFFPLGSRWTSNSLNVTYLGPQNIVSLLSCPSILLTYHVHSHRILATS